MLIFLVFGRSPVRHAVFIVSPMNLWSFRVGLPSPTQDVVCQRNEERFYTKQGGFALQQESICIQEAGTVRKSLRNTPIYICRFKRTQTKRVASLQHICNPNICGDCHYKVTLPSTLMVSIRLGRCCPPFSPLSCFIGVTAGAASCEDGGGTGFRN